MSLSKRMYEAEQEMPELSIDRPSRAPSLAGGTDRRWRNQTVEEMQAEWAERDRRWRENQEWQERERKEGGV